MEVDFLGRGLSFPIAVKKDRLVMAEGEELIRQSILTILGTAKGERVMRPDFGCGLNELVFAPNDSATATLVGFYVREALLTWEPRIEVLNINVIPGIDEPNRLDIQIDYKIKTTNTKYNLVYPFYLERVGR